MYPNPEFIMEKMIDTAIILRKRYEYKGYIHIKIMPGTSRQTVEEAIKVANRVSVNIEAPTEERLKSIAKGKSLKNDLIPKIEEVSELLQIYRKKTQTTQMIVGVGTETDMEILTTSQHLYETSTRRLSFLKER